MLFFFLSLLSTVIIRSQTIDLGFGNSSLGYQSNKNSNDVAGTIIFSSINTSMNTINFLVLKKQKEKSNAGFGIITGLTQLTYGAIYDKEKSLQAINVSYGSATIIFSVICLLKKERKKEKKLVLTSYSPKIPLIGSYTGLSLNIKF